LEYVQQLLEAGADPDGVSGSNRERMTTPLNMASGSGRLDLVQLLLEFGADPLLGVDGRTPFIAASKAGNQEICELLLERGADINLPDALGRTPLMYAILNGKKGWDFYKFGERDPFLQFLLEQGADLKAKDKSGKSVEAYAFKKGYSAELSDFRKRNRN